MKTSREKQATKPIAKKRSGKKQTARPKKIQFPGLKPPIEFPEVKGKTIEELRLYLSGEDNGVDINFTDKTYLNFDFEPRLTVRTRLADVRSGELRDLKSWPAMMSQSSYTDEDEIA